MRTVTLKSPIYADTVVAPTSKSAAHRILIAAAFADRDTTIALSSSCDDIDATVRCLTALGVGIEEAKGALTVHPIKRESVIKGALLDCGESGSTLRFLLPVCAALGANARFMRHGRLPQRPLSPLREVLTAHGLTLKDEGALLLTEGTIGADAYTIAANVSSQYVTGLLFALSLLEDASTLSLTGTVESAPYIEMTVDTLSRFGALPEALQGEHGYRICGYKKAPLCTPVHVTPEGDYSGAAFPLALGAIGTHGVTVTGLSSTSFQGDREMLALLARFGALVSTEKNSVTVSPAPLHGIAISAEQIPDLVPILAVVATAAKGKTTITGAARLRLKESDRLAAITAFLRTLGADISETDDGLVIVGGKPLQGGTVDVCGDHRIAMSAAAAALLTTEAVVIPGADCVSKSYPSFFESVIYASKGEERNSL